jgi:hypothetical protein
LTRPSALHYLLAGGGHAEDLFHRHAVCFRWIA